MPPRIDGRNSPAGWRMKGAADAEASWSDRLDKSTRRWPEGVDDAYHTSSNTVLCVSFSRNSHICRGNILGSDGTEATNPCYA